MPKYVDKSCTGGFLLTALPSARRRTVIAWTFSESAPPIER
jgi:hypothetical protein